MTTNSPTGLQFDPIAEARRQWRGHGWAEDSVMVAVTSVMRVQQLVLAQIERALRPFDLTFARYEALVLLHFSRRGSLPLGKIGERLQVHPTSVTNIIDRLQDQELVRRVAHPADRRTTLAEITPTGTRVVVKATKAVTAAFAELPLTGASAEQLFEILQEFRHLAGDFVDKAPPGE
ncbi:MAG: regulatory protein MarR [Actinomycetia bacterium]|nr:regulatory protein MarR [Actinomycetes bacterium]